jgi:conjugative transfer pilus assembly protein TraH
MLSRYISLFVIICFLSLHCIPAHAGWVDDWLDQHTTASQGYFSGQQRGYYTFGSFSGRMTTGTLNPISIAPPRVSAGCGGIDVFLGAMSFTDFQYLVQKLQTIMQNAPVIAFEMALGVLSEQLKNTLNQVEEFLNSLNNIQVNDCQASKAMVAYLGSKLSNDKELGEMATKYLQKSGVTQVYKEAKDVIFSSGGNPAQITGSTQPVLEEAIAGCSAEIRQVFGTAGSLLDHLAGQLTIPADYVELIRGVAGDVNIEVTGGAIQGVKVPSCYENNQFLMDDFLKGTVQKMNASGQCVQITDVNSEVNQYVSNKLLSIMSNMINGTSLTPDDEDFIDSLPIPVYPVLKSSVGTGQEAVILSLMSDVAARAYVFMMLSDMYKLLHDLIDEGDRIISAQPGAIAGQDEHKCMMANFQGVKDELVEMKDTAFSLTGALREIYSNSAIEVNSILELVSRMQDVKDTIHYLVSTRYGQQVADRAMGGVSPSSSN